MTSFRIQNALPRLTGPRPLRVALTEAPLDPEDAAGDWVGVVSGSPFGGGGGAALGPVAGTPMPASAPGGGFGFPGTFPTMGPANTIFGFGGWGGWGWPYPVVPPSAPFEVVCQWEDNPPREDSRLICVQRPRRYPVAWGAPGWGW